MEKEPKINQHIVLTKVIDGKIVDGTVDKGRQHTKKRKGFFNFKRTR